MPLTGVDESVKQAILQKNTFENMDLVSSVTTLRSRRGSHVTANFFSSVGVTVEQRNTNNGGSRRQSRVQFSDLPIIKDTQTLDLPGTSNGVLQSESPV